MNKKESNIAIFVLSACIFLTTGFSYISVEKIRALEEKVQIRDSLQHRIQEHHDSLFFDCVTRFIESGNKEKVMIKRDTVYIYVYKNN